MTNVRLVNPMSNKHVRRKSTFSEISKRNENFEKEARLLKARMKVEQARLNLMRDKEKEKMKMEEEKLKFEEQQEKIYKLKRSAFEMREKVRKEGFLMKKAIRDRKRKKFEKEKAMKELEENFKFWKKTRHVNASPSPTPSVTQKPSSQSGWDYWARVYSEDSQNSAPSRDVRVSDMLSSDTLVRAKLLFLNVPGLPTAHKNIILNLIKKEIREDISIQDVVVVPPGKWFLNFYRPEDALKVFKVFNGFNYRGHTLVVRFCYPDGTYGDETALTELVQCSNNAKGRLFEQREIVQDTLSSECWTIAEYEVLQKFETELVNLLKTHAYLPYHNVLQSMRTLFSNRIPSATSSIFISEALTQWPTGFIRMFNRNVKVVSNTMCLSTSSYYTQRIMILQWKGAALFIAIHGSQWFQKTFEIDAPIRILAQSLRGTWPKSAEELASLLTDISSGVAIVNRVLYLSSNPVHHEKIIDNLATYQDDCTDVYFLPLSSLDGQKLMIVDVEDL
ncbi:Protein CBG02436 [Caenorhabditis briggsae]|uniref:Protein CBG02436 n=1 Tax=Caenorhabditis briggsae TaxID=6238 RepID=A8WUB8_CAEBR|nr:Protein CBG02436 [Caenorhabditis briggsae]CAP24080.2 Protein CBG02436 [Caenorhabditis briggsae]